MYRDRHRNKETPPLYVAGRDASCDAQPRGGGGGGGFAAAAMVDDMS